MANVEEGVYYEKLFSPVKIEVRKATRKVDDKGKPVRRSWAQARRGELTLTLEDQNGEKLKVEGTSLVSRVLGYLQPYTSLSSVSEIKDKPETEMQEILANALVKVKEKGKQIKGLFDKKGNLCGIASTIHKQISWQQVRNIIETAVKEVCGKVVQPEGSQHPFRWSYQVPVANKEVSAWIGVHGGNNLIQGRSGIHVWSRWRNEREETDRGGIRRPACLNWCGMWQAPLQFFKIDASRLDNIYKVLGAENVEALKLAQFHINPDMQKFSEEVKTQLKSMVKAMKKMRVVIDQSINSPLSFSEMAAILEAYSRKAGIPEYVVEQIMNHAKEMGQETIWGFSNAVSWVRTHGEFKNFAICKPVEDRELTRKLENIAGEVLSLTPTINDIHKRVGEITLERLLPAESKEIEVRA